MEPRIFKQYQDKFKKLVGGTVESVGVVYDEELGETPCLTVFCADGKRRTLFAMSDEEGNDFGSMEVEE